MNVVPRGVLVLQCLLLVFANLFVCLAEGQEQATRTGAGFQITGKVKSGKAILPGVTVTAANTLTGKKYCVASGLDGSLVIRNLPPGRYVVKVEFMGFATLTQEVVLNPENPVGKVEAELQLASRQQEQPAGVKGAIPASRGFQSLAVDGSLPTSSGGSVGTEVNRGSPSASDLFGLPMNGADADAATESFSVSGTRGRTQDFGTGSEEEIQMRIQEFGAQQEGGAGGFGSSGGGPVMIGRLGRRFDTNKQHGFLYLQDDAAGLDARPYSLTGQESANASYNRLRFGMQMGGPLKIPKIFDNGNATFFSLGWNGTRGSTPYSAYSSVPTVAERDGIFTGLTDKNGNPILIYDPRTGLPFPGNAIDAGRFSSAAKFLLKYLPPPTLAGTTQNFHYLTSAESDTDSLRLRLIHNFSGPGSQIGQPGRGGGGRRLNNNINFGLSWSRSSRVLENPLPALAGSAGSQGWNANLRWIYGRGRFTNTAGVTYNRNRAHTTNLYSEGVDVAGNAGITGISPHPFDWGLPGTSFNNFAGFSGPIPNLRLGQSYVVSDGLIWNRGKHTVRFGGDYRRILQNVQSARNAEGSFVFTGFATSEYLPGTTQPVQNTGYDFADFLLGLPQQTSLQSGTNSYAFRANSFDFYAQDQWRVSAQLSLILGLRYEYNGPFTETQNHIANLDVAPGFTAAVPVLPGQTSPYSGYFPASLVHPDRNNFGPRVGLAWRVGKSTVMRAGYAINYNLAQYSIMVQNLAFQPPFAVTATNLSSSASPLTLENGFPAVPPLAVTNNFAVEPNYLLPYVQIWSLDIQRQLPVGMQLSVGYNGEKGTRLDTQRALVAGGQPFIFETSEGSSCLNGASVRVRKRMSKGLGLSAIYVFSKSIDDASSIGGGAVVVVQNPYDIRADRGPSSFDQKQRFIGNWMYDLPFGDGKWFFRTGPTSHVLGAWQWSGDFTIASGFYYTPRVLGSLVDINRGVSGSLRANIIPGAAVSRSNPTTREWFNTAAFCVPGPDCENPANSMYGDAGPNIIEGPAQFTFDMAISKTITIKESRALELRLQATNIFNTPYFSTLNTVVNSRSFGQITGVANMRRVTMVARFRF